MAVFDARYVTAHILSMHTTRAKGYRAGPGGWARVPICSCGWNRVGFRDSRWNHSPSGSIFADKYRNEEEARNVWQTEHIDVLEPLEDAGQLLLVAVDL